MFKGIAPPSQFPATVAMLPVAPHPGRTMHVVKKQFMYVSKPFGGEGGEGLQRAQYVCSTYVLLHPCLPGGPKEGGNATSPLHSRGSPNKGGQNQSKKKTKKKPKQKFYSLQQCTSKRGWQSANQSVRQASSQSDKNTHFGFFYQWQTRVQAVGRTTGLRTGSGQMVMHAAADFLIIGLNPGPANMAAAPAPAPASTDQDLNRRPTTRQLGALPFDRGWI